MSQSKFPSGAHGQPTAFSTAVVLQATVVPPVGPEGALPSEPGLIRSANSTEDARSEQPNGALAEIAGTLEGSSESETALGSGQASGHVMRLPSDWPSSCGAGDVCPTGRSVVIEIERLGAPEQDGGGLCKLQLRPKNPIERAKAT